MSSSIFREEALARCRTSPWQPLLLSRPVPGLLLALSALLTAVALVVFAAAFPFARKEQATGYLTPAEGWSRVSARSFAVVRRCLVEAGDLVEVGDALYQLASGEGVAAGQAVESKLLDDVDKRRAALQTRLATVDAQYENDRLLHGKERESAERQIAHLEAEVESHMARLSIAKRQHRDGERLLASGALSESDLLDLADRVQSRAAVVATQKRELALLRSAQGTQDERLNLLELGREQARAVVLEQLHALAMEESRIRAQETGIVLAPRSGRIASVRIGEGDWVRPGDAMLDILPNGVGLEARLFAGSAAVGGVEVGHEVRVYLDAFPYERHGAQAGRVLAISETTVGPRHADMIGSAGLLGTATFRIDVAFPEGFDLSPIQRRTLRPGMTVSADLVRGYGTLIDWLMEPLRSAARRL